MAHFSEIVRKLIRVIHYEYTQSVKCTQVSDHATFDRLKKHTLPMCICHATYKYAVEKS